MAFNPSDLFKLKDLLDRNKDLLDSFFGGNPFSENFMRGMQDIPYGQYHHNPTSNPEAGVSSTGHPASERVIPMDVIQRKNELLLVFEIPGLSGQDDVNIKILGSTLILEGEIRRNYLLSGKEITNFERNVGHFSKKVNLPIIYDSKRIRARYNKGLMEIRIPILKQSNQDRITINFTQSDS